MKQINFILLMTVAAMIIQLNMKEIVDLNN